MLPHEFIAWDNWPHDEFVRQRGIYKDYWTGLNENIFIDQNIMCAGRVNVNDMPSIALHNSADGSSRIKEYITDDTDNTDNNSAPPAPAPAPTAPITGALYELRTAPKLSSKQSSKSWWGGASVDLGVVSSGVSKSGSEGSCIVTSSFVDMNGDGYPDYITDTQIEYTNRHGGRDGEITSAASGQLTEVSKSSGTSTGFSGGILPSIPIKNSINADLNESNVNSETGSVPMSLKLSNLKSVGVGAGRSINTSILTNSYVDVNGDELPDRVYFEGNRVKVCLNLGYGFSLATDWGLKDVTCISSNYSDGSTFSASTGGSAYDALNIFKDLLGDSKSKETKKIIEKITKGIGVSFGFNAANTTSFTLFALRDINMDGLVDKVYKNNQGKYAFSLNKGSSFTDIVALDVILDLFKSVSTSYSASININFRINLFWFVYLTVGGGGNYTWGHDYILSDLMDIDGDGFADIVKADENNKTKLYVRKSKIGYTNKLKSVTNPLGGVVTIDYERSKASFDHPGGKWVMKSVAMYDGLTDDGEATDGITMKNEFEYGSGKYDRYEREFLGFGEVASYNSQIVNSVWRRYRGAKQLYLTDNIYHKGLLMGSEVYEPESLQNPKRTYAESLNKNYDYSVKRIAKSNDSKAGKYQLETVDLSRYNMFNNQYIIYSPLKYAKNSNYGYNAQNNWVNITTSETYSEYNTSAGTHGEMILCKYSDKGQLGETGAGAYNYRTEIMYLDTIDMTLFALPKSHTVYDGANTSKVLRKIEYYWWPQFASQLKTVINHIDTENATKAVTDIIYDQYGNISSKTLPVNYRGQRMRYQYEYDPMYHMYPIKITDAFGYTYQMPEYDYRFGIPLKTIDINGNVMTQTVDNRGRIETITGPNEQGTGAPYTIKFIYNPQKIVKNGSSYSAMPYAITMHYDATKASGSDDDKNLETVTFVDGFGRPIQVKKESVVNGQPKMIVSGRAKYDAFGRVTEAYYPVVDALAKTAFNPAFGDDNAIPPTITTYDVLDRVLTMKLPDNSLTKMDYSIAEGKLLTRITDANGKYQDTYTAGDGKTVKTVQYKTYNGTTGADPLTTLFEYDAINQLVKVTDAANKTTESVYDLAGRRTQVKHPASGITTFKYDAAGNLTEKLTANLKNTGAQPIKYQYDFNRLKEINYPLHPENNVKYVYGTKDEAGAANGYRAGRLKSLEDGSGGQEFKYGKMGEVAEVRRTLVIPNQAVATYVTRTVYDSWNRLLSMTYPDGEIVNYSYNTGGLLTGVASTSNVYVADVKYDKFEQRTYLRYGNGKETNYTYDEKNRQLKYLKVGVGTDYIMNNAYIYDAVGNVRSITNTGAAKEITPGKGIGGNMTHNYFYDNLYRLETANGTFTGYNGKTAHYTLEMGYDNMHNITRKKQDITQTGVQFAGTLQAGYDLNYTINTNNSQQISNIAENSYRTEGSGANTPETKESQFSYDANGNLLGIYTGTKQGDKLKVTNTRKLLWDEENHLLASCDNGYLTSYYYDAAGERTVKMSGDAEGVFVNGALSGARTGTTNFTAYISPYMLVRNGGYYTKNVYMGSQRITSKVSNSGIFTTSPVNTTEQQAKLAQQTTLIKERFDSLGVKYSGVQQTGGLVSASPATAADKYFYHPDHLGSSSLITNGSGDLVQHIQYVPFGEVFVEERNATWSTPYKFNGKEQDEETGLCYYGARYYDPRTSVWLSVDPLKGKTLNVSAYVYCYNNPVRYIDPDGRYNTETGANISRWMYNIFHKTDAGPVFKNPKGQYGYEITGRTDNGEFQKGYAYGRNGYNGNANNGNSSDYRQRAGYGFYGTNSSQGIKWPGADYILGYIDASSFLYPISNPKSKAETIYETAKKAGYIMDYMFKAGVEMDIPEIEDEWGICGDPHYDTHMGQSGTWYSYDENKKFYPVDTVYPRYRGDTIAKITNYKNKRTNEIKAKIEIYTPARYKK